MERVERFLASHPYSDETSKTYRRILAELIKLPDLAGLDAVGLVKFIQSQPGWGNSQQWVALCASRKFLAWLYGVTHPAMTARIKRIKSRRQRSLTASRALDLLASFDPRTRKGCRDLAIAALGLDTGLRCSELCRLKLQDVELELRTLQVITKGGQWGVGVFSPETAQYIREWLAVRQAKPGVSELFITIKTGKALCRQTLNHVVSKWGKQIDLKISPHDLRRSFATLSTIFGAPSRVVQAAGRWSDISMVEHYTQGLDPAEIAPYLPVTKLYKRVS